MACKQLPNSGFQFLKRIMMNIINFTLALSVSLFVFGAAHAQTSTSSATSAPIASSTSGTQQVNQGITFNSPGESRQTIESNGTQKLISTQIIEGTQTLKNVPSVSGPALTTSTDTCMGSSSGSLNGPGFGISVGGTWSDPNCKLLKNSRELWNMGMKAAAMALICTDPANRDALEITGYECPQTARDKKKIEQVSVTSPALFTN